MRQEEQAVEALARCGGVASDDDAVDVHFGIPTHLQTSAIISILINDMAASVYLAQHGARSVATLNDNVDEVSVDVG